MRRLALTLEQRKLALSLVVNFATRIPGLLGIVLMLPLLHRDLGTDAYALLLGAMALGATATFLFGGFQTVGRRTIGEGYARGDRQAEADSFVTLMAVNGVLVLGALVVMAAYSFTQDNGGTMLAIAALGAVSAYFNTFDNVRTAYNEHYVTAILQIVFQLVNIGAALLLPALRENAVLACFVLSGHGLIASLVAGCMLLRQRRYLLSGRVVAPLAVARQGLAIGMADGVLAATLSFSVVWVQSTSSAGVAGWYGTLMRLFQTILVPVVLLLMPLASYVRLNWHNKPPHAQSRIVQASVVFGLAYGAVAAVALAVISHFYIDRLLGLPAPGGWLMQAPIYALFTAIIGYRAYSSIAYLVLDGTRLASAIAIQLVVALGVVAVASLYLPTLETIIVYAVLVGTILVVSELWSAARFRRGLTAA